MARPLLRVAFLLKFPVGNALGLSVFVLCAGARRVGNDMFASAEKELKLSREETLEQGRPIFLP